jgi:putative transposase
MQTVHIYPLPRLRKGYAASLREAHKEAARLWNVCRDLHLAARKVHTRWPDLNDLHQATRGRFALHSQKVQMIARTFLANIETTKELRKTNRTIRYPYTGRRYYPLLWPAQAMSSEWGRIVLPMGRGSCSLVFRLDLPERIGGCKLVWKDGYKLSVPAVQAPEPPGTVQATGELGEIQQVAVTTAPWWGIGTWWTA